jgi:hypothetical protein
VRPQKPAPTPASRARRSNRPAGKKGPALARGRGARVTSRKLAISFDAGLADQVVRAAQLEADGNVSGWLAEAARAALRHGAARQLLQDYEREHGDITERELSEVDKLWPAG